MTTQSRDVVLGSGFAIRTNGEPRSVTPMYRHTMRRTRQHERTRSPLGGRIRQPLGLVALSSVMAVACATIIHGSSQDVGITSEPAGATVTIDAVNKGKTPMSASLSRKNVHAVVISMEGYQPFSLTTERKVDGWVWGNVVFGGLIGLAVDAATGAIYKVKPDQVSTRLVAVHASRGKDVLFVVLVPQSERSWQEIAHLARQ